MTAPASQESPVTTQTASPTAPARAAAWADLKRLLAFGSGVGIEVGASDLTIVAVRVRFTRIHVGGFATIANFASRPAAEWGAEYAAFLRSNGMAHVSATVTLPRREVIVRQVMLAGVARRDRAAAIQLQLDTLHPYGDEEVAWDWTPAGEQAALVGIARRDTVEHYARLFTEAGIAVASFTFSASALHGAVRMNAAPPQSFLALRVTATGSLEAYGESPSRPVFSAEFHLPPERAAVLALAELRLPPQTDPRNVAEVLPQPTENPVQNDLSRNALPYATALAGACPRLARAANILPPEFRRSSSRAIYIPTAVLLVLVAVAVAAMALYSHFVNQRYLEKLQTQIQQLEPTARRAATLDREIDLARARSRLLDDFRSQTRTDLDALNQLTKLLEPPAWSNSISITRDQARISGEAPQAAPLLRLLDSS
ncbi:MAG: hypothetical protein JOZ22_03090, partial [Acidobacteriia bacterium]|nr:hypothetical protein [Terriglobia bacterium]